MDFLLVVLTKYKNPITSINTLLLQLKIISIAM